MMRLSVGVNGTCWEPTRPRTRVSQRVRRTAAAALGLGGVEVGPAVAEGSGVEGVDASGEAGADAEGLDAEGVGDVLRTRP